MRKAVLFIMLVVFLFSINKYAFTQTASLKEIKDVAKNFYWEQSEISSVKVNYNTISPDIAFIESRNNNTIYYVVNLPNYNVHVYVSSDKRIKAVLGLGDGLYNTDDSMPPSYISWMEHYTEEIDYFLTDIKDGASYTKIQEGWTKYKTKNPPSGSKSVSPLLSTTWSQGCYYNEDCPYDPLGPCGHALVGCVATAMAQIMKYHNHPQLGKGYHSYTHPVYGTLAAHFAASQHDWSAMPDEYGVYSPNSEVARLLYYCGVSVDMDYGPNSSGAYSSKVDDAFEDYFKYHDIAQLYEKNNYSTSVWEDKMRDQCDIGIPFYYAGDDNTTGHAFVCDGYTGTNYFHFNWGWGGTYDGYFYLNSLTPGGSFFSYGQEAVFDIYPYKITVYSPNGGNNLKLGYSHTIRWFASGSENVKIELVNGWDYYTITSSTVNDGSYNWTVPSNFAIGDDYKIKITSTTASHIYDYSDNYFAISEPYINVTFPGAGTNYARGYTYSIYWQTNLSTIENVKIELYKNDSYYSTIASSCQASARRYDDWQIPSNQPIGDDYKIKITSLSNGTVYDISDNNFTINEPYIDLIRPVAGGSWARGHTHTMVWYTNISCLEEIVKVELYKNDSYYSTITSSCQACSNQTQSTGLYDWQIPSNHEIGDDYKIKVTSLNDGTVNDFSDDSFTIEDPYLTVNYPNNGENFACGYRHNISWRNNFSTAENIKIELYKNDSYYSTIINSTTNYGFYYWTIPSDHETGNDYKIKTTILTNPNIYDFSNDNFTISEPYINVLSPNGGEYVAPGTPYQILWDDNLSTDEDIKIELYKNDSFYSTIIDTLTDNPGYYYWEVDTNHLLGNDYKVKITGLTNPNINDFSNNNFSIDVPITLTSPIGGEIWQKGEPYTITWTDNISEDVVIELHKNGFYYSTISDSTPSDGNYIWNIPDNQLMSEMYKVVIRSINTLTGSSISNSYFTISDITIHSPDGGEYLGQGISSYITWAGHYVSENIKIDLYKTDNLYSTLMTSTPNDGSYSWNIADSITTGTDYKIKISSTTDTSFYDFSDYYFTIDSGYCENVQIIEGCGLSYEQWVEWYCCDGGYWYNSSNNACGVINPGAEHIFSFVAPYTGTYSITVNLYTGGEYINPVSFLWKSSTCSTSEGWNCIDEVWGEYNIYGSMYWTAGTTYYILLDNYGDTEDFEETTFYINSPFPLTVTSPNEYEELSQGTSHSITWEDNISENVKIELIKYGYNSIITASTPSDGSYIWDIPNDQILGDFYKIKISSINSSAIYDYSNRGFTIVTGVPANNIIQDVSINSGQAECYNATGTITVAGAGTTVVVSPGAQATFIAGQKIIFNPGFTSLAGSYTDAHITTTNNYCNSQQSMLETESIETHSAQEKAVVTNELTDYNSNIAISIYPNPTNGNTTIDFMGVETTADIMVLNFQGGKVLNVSCNNSTTANIDISNLPQGMYVIVIKTQLDVVTKRLVKAVN